MRLKRRNRILVVALLVAMALSMLLPAPALAAAPTINDAVSVPPMVSLFGDIGPAGATPDSPLGPGWTTFVVKITGDAATSVTLDLKTLFLSLLPVDMDPANTAYAASRIPAASKAAWESYLNGLATTAMTYDTVGGIWKKAFELDDLFENLPSYLTSAESMSLVLEDLRMGTTAIAIPVAATNAGGTTTLTLNLAVADAQIPLKSGWNAVSAPFKLSGLWSSTSVDAVLRWDAATQTWATATPTEIQTRSPLEAFFIHTQGDTLIGANLYRSYSAPSTRSMTAGWNLVGSAPDFIKNLTLTYPKTGTGAKVRGLMKANDNFISLLNTSAGTTGYTMVLSIGRDVSFTHTYKYGAYDLGTSYPWLLGQPAWSFTTVDPASSIVDDPVTPDNYFGWVVPFGAYWVYMENADTLAGFTSTPVSNQWLSKARQTILGF